MVGVPVDVCVLGCTCRGSGPGENRECILGGNRLRKSRRGFARNERVGPVVVGRGESKWTSGDVEVRWIVSYVGVRTSGDGCPERHSYDNKYGELRPTQRSKVLRSRLYIRLH